MATIQVRNLPEENARVLKVRAAKSGKSLQEYMRDYLIEQTSKPTVDELLEEVRAAHDPTTPDLPLDVTLAGIKEAWD